MAVSTTTVVKPIETPVGFRYVEWGPMILGALGASAISIVLLTFGAALGLSSISPYPYAGLSAKAIGIVGATYAALVMVASFGAGGYLAGRLRTAWAGANQDEVHFRDGAHGFGVWALGVVAGAVIATSGATGVIKTAVQATSAVAVAGTAGAASNPAAASIGRELSTRPMDYAVDRVLAPRPAGDQEAASQGHASRADLAAPVARAFSANLHNPQLDVQDRAMLVQLVVQQTGMSQADAEKRVDDAFARLKEAEQKARDAAEAARKAALIAAFAAAAILAISCAAACAAAALGARHRDENTVITLFGSRRFW